MCHDLLLVAIEIHTVCPLYCLIELLVRLHQLWVQEIVVRVVHVSQRRTGVQFARVENGLRMLFDVRPRLLIDFWEDEVVVHSGVAVSVVALQATSNDSHPCILQL